MSPFSLEGWDCASGGHFTTDGASECVVCGEVPETSRKLVPVKQPPNVGEWATQFNYELGFAMSTGSPGPCHFGDIVQVELGNTETGEPPTYEPEHTQPYHILDGNDVESLQRAGTGGLAVCERCGIKVFVPGRSDCGLVVKGRGYGPGMNGVEL